MYYEVLARLHSYQGSEYLTYASKQKLDVGDIVSIHVRNRPALAIVMSTTTKPSFATKPIDELVDLSRLPEKLIDLIKWMRLYYPSPLGLLAQLFIPNSFPKKQIAQKQAPQKPKKAALPSLTTDQARVLKQISTSTSPTTLLHGDTGSGKTRIYSELAAQQLKAGKSVLILTPEIALTPQLVQEVRANLPATEILVSHSGLTEAERRRIWLQVLDTVTPIVLIGPRSALFAPFNKLGLIVMDEFHEPAYKQEQAPYYQTIRVAGQLAHLHKAQLLLGSATPLVSEYYFAHAKSAHIVRMTSLAVKTTHKSEVKVVDLRDKANLTRSPHFSNQLLDSIEQALSRGEQALVFLNRRGTARLVLCENCGWQALCPNCDLPLTYHGDKHQMLCHTCGYKSAVPLSCPVCASNQLIFRSIGTKSLTDALKRLFPKAKVQRFDSDSSKDERFEQHFERVKAGEVDILVGTQLLAKGLDLPSLGVVGVVLADSSLYLPDYTAEERTYQLLCQVIGRVGRGHLPGIAIIQTYRPDGPAIQAATSKNWEVFYEQQLKEREQYLFPPFCFLMKITRKRASQASAQKATEDIALQLKKFAKPIQVIGPSPAFHEKAAGRYVWQVVVKARDRKQLVALTKYLPSDCTYDLDPNNLL